jgi:hypothetical protein
LAHGGALRLPIQDGERRPGWSQRERVWNRLFEEGPSADVTSLAIVPSTVVEAFAPAGLRPAGAVRWGTPIPLDAPGVYVVALTDDAGSFDGALAEPPIDLGALDRLLVARPELRLDRSRPSARSLADRLGAFWLPDEVVVYEGLAGTSVRRRIRQYYATPLLQRGDRTLAGGG